MRFVCLDDTVCLVTHFTLDQEHNMEKISSGSITTGKSISGEMLLFRKNSLPKLFDRSGIPKGVSLEIVDDGRLYSLDNVLFDTFREMPHSYDKCEAAYCEYIAKDWTIETLASETINRVGVNR